MPNTDMILSINEWKANINLEYSLTPYHPATYYDPAEGGEVEDIRVTINEVLNAAGECIEYNKMQEVLLIAIIEDKFETEIQEACEKHATTLDMENY